MVWRPRRRRRRRATPSCVTAFAVAAIALGVALTTVAPPATAWYPALERPPQPQPPPSVAAGSIPVDGLVGPLRLADLPVPFGFPKDPAATVVAINVQEVNVQSNNTLTAVSVGINTIDVNALFVNRLIVTTVAINFAQVNVIRLNEVFFNAVVLNQLVLNRIVTDGVFGNFVALNSMVADDIFTNSVYVNVVQLHSLQLNSLGLNIVLIDCVFLNTMVLNSIFVNVVFVNVVLIDTVFLNSILVNTVYSNLTIINRLLVDSVLINVVRANEVATNAVNAGVLTANSVSNFGVETNKPDAIAADLLTLLSHSGGAMALDPFAQLQLSSSAASGGNDTTVAPASTAATARNGTAQEWWTTVPFDTRLHGSLPVWNTTTNAYTASAAGLYHVECALLVSANALTPALAALGADRFAALQLHLVSPANGTASASLAVGAFARDLMSGAVDPIGNQHSAPAALTLSADVALRLNQTLAFRVLIPTPPAAPDGSADDVTAVRLLWAASLSLVPSRASFAFLHPLTPPALPPLPPAPF